MFFRLKISGPRKYLQIVQNYWDKQKKKTRQRVIATLGKADQLKESGELNSLIASAQRFSDKLLVLSAHQKGEAIKVSARHLGPLLVFERLWEESGCRKVLNDLLAQRCFEFNMEGAIFLSVLHRLLNSGSDRHCKMWMKDFGVENCQGLKLHHLYRAMMWLGETLVKEEDVDGVIPFCRRCTKDQVEEKLFNQRRDLFSSLEVVFFDTTSIYFEGEGGEDLGQYGHSKDHRPDRKQLIVGAILDQEGHPVCCEIWPGNTADVKSLVPIVKRLQKRFRISQVCIVADRGMISKEVLEWLESEKWPYIIGVRMRKQQEVNEEVLCQGDDYKEIEIKKKTKKKNKKDDNKIDNSNGTNGTNGMKSTGTLKIKEVRVESRRYIVCLNEEQARKDAFDREAILESLQERLKQGEKSLIGNKGYRKYLKVADRVRDEKDKAFEIDLQKIKDEERYDGKWVLRTNTDFDAEQVALKYKELWMVEEIFRSMKSLINTRPIYHRSSRAIRGHVFCSFLALILIKELRKRMEEKGLDYEWQEVLLELNRLEEVEIEKDGKSFVIITDRSECCREVCNAVGVAIPPAFRQVSM
jgi:transposase